MNKRLLWQPVLWAGICGWSVFCACIGEHCWIVAMQSGFAAFGALMSITCAMQAAVAVASQAKKVGE